MNTYVSTKQVKAEPCKSWSKMGKHTIGEDGYKIYYPDGYISWCPKNVFKKQYLKTNNNSRFTQEDVDNLIDTYSVKDEDGTVIVKAILKNGFVIEESYSYLNHRDYIYLDGERICKNRISTKVLSWLDFLYHISKNGFIKDKKIENPGKFKIFLGGTCNGSTWRDHLLTSIKEDDRYEKYKNYLDIFNPVVEDWNKSARQKELAFKEDCNLQIYVLTPRIKGIYSIAEIMSAIHKTKDDLLVGFVEDGQVFNEQMVHSIKAFIEDFVPRDMKLSGSLNDLKDNIYEKVERWFNKGQKPWCESSK